MVEGLVEIQGGVRPSPEHGKVIDNAVLKKRRLMGEC